MITREQIIRVLSNWAICGSAPSKDDRAWDIAEDLIAAARDIPSDTSPMPSDTSPSITAVPHGLTTRLSTLQRSAMSPLEMSVWGAAFALHLKAWTPDGPERELTLQANAAWWADAAVYSLRDLAHHEERTRRTEDAASKHRLRFYREHGVWAHAGCTCGYRPRGWDQPEGADPEELLTLHFIAMGVEFPKIMTTKVDPSK